MLGVKCIMSCSMKAGTSVSHLVGSVHSPELLLHLLACEGSHICKQARAATFSDFILPSPGCPTTRNSWFDLRYGDGEEGETCFSLWGATRAVSARFWASEAYVGMAWQNTAPGVPRPRPHPGLRPLQLRLIRVEKDTERKVKTWKCAEREKCSRQSGWRISGANFRGCPLACALALRQYRCWEPESTVTDASQVCLIEGFENGKCD